MTSKSYNWGKNKKCKELTGFWQDTLHLLNWMQWLCLTLWQPWLHWQLINNIEILQNVQKRDNLGQDYKKSLS